MNFSYYSARFITVFARNEYCAVSLIYEVLQNVVIHTVDGSKTERPTSEPSQSISTIIDYAPSYHFNLSEVLYSLFVWHASFSYTLN